jgi:hypothetical protein
MKDRTKRVTIVMSERELARALELDLEQLWAIRIQKIQRQILEESILERRALRNGMAVFTLHESRSAKAG